MTTYILDSNIFLRLFIEDVPEQTKKVEKVFERAKTGKAKLIVPQIVIFEIVFALTKFYKQSKEDIVEKINSIVASSYLSLQNKTAFNQTVKIYKNHNLSFADCFLAVRAKQLKSNLFTFDKKLKKLKV